MYHTLTITVARRPWASFRRIGGLYHWRIGRFGGCVYLSRAR